MKSWQTQTAATWEQAIGKWIQDQFERWQLGAQVLLDGLNSACAATLQQAPLEVCSSMLADWSEGGANDLGRNPGAVKKALKEIEHFVGWPGTNDVEEPIVLREALAGAAEVVGREALNRLADVALSALSDPRFRLAVGAGDAVQREIYTYSARWPNSSRRRPSSRNGGPPTSSAALCRCSSSFASARCYAGATGPGPPRKWWSSSTSS